MLKLLPLLLMIFSSVVQAESATGRKFGVAWEADPKAKAYEVRFEKVDGDIKPLLKKVTGTVFKGVLKPGEYRFSVRAYDTKGQPGLWSEPQPIAVAPLPVTAKLPAPDSLIKANTLKDGKVQFAWNRGPGEDHYELTIQALDTDFKKVIRTQDTQIALELPPNAKYEWGLQAFTKGETGGDTWTTLQNFELSLEQLASPTITEPDGKTAVSELNWSLVSGARGYEVELFHKEYFSPDWVSLQPKGVVTDNKIVFKKALPPGQYKLWVAAVSKGYNPSEPATLEFVIKPLQRDLASIPEEIDQKAKPPKKEASQ